MAETLNGSPRLNRQDRQDATDRDREVASRSLMRFGGWAAASHTDITAGIEALAGRIGSREVVEKVPLAPDYYPEAAR